MSPCLELEYVDGLEGLLEKIKNSISVNSKVNSKISSQDIIQNRSMRHRTKHGQATTLNRAENTLKFQQNIVPAKGFTIISGLINEKN